MNYQTGNVLPQLLGECVRFGPSDVAHSQCVPTRIFGTHQLSINDIEVANATTC